MAADAHVGSFQTCLTFILSVFCLAMLLALSTPVAAQDASDSKAAAPPAGEEDKILLARTLEEYGMKNEDSLALVTAAKLYKELSARVLRRGEEGKDGKTVNPEALLNAAAAFAKNDQVKELVEIVRIETKGYYSYRPECWYEWYCSNPYRCWDRLFCY